jgi:hypothetical protein
MNNENELVLVKTIEFYEPSEKIGILVNALRMVAKDEDIKSKSLYIPDNCEKYGFAEGTHNLGQMLQFFADMLEE